MTNYNSLLSYSFGEPAMKKDVEIKVMYSKFDPSNHEFMKNSTTGGVKYSSNNDFGKLKDLAHLTQFVTKYWDISKHPTINLLWVRDKGQMTNDETITTFNTYFPLVSLSVTDDVEAVMPRAVMTRAENLFLFWDTREKLSDETLADLSPIFLQIVLDGDILRQYGEKFWDGRLYFNIGDKNVRLVTNKPARKIKYSADIFDAKNLRPSGNFYNIFSGAVKYF